MDKSEIKELLDKDYLRVLVTFEVIGNPKEQVDKAIKLVMEKIKENSMIKFIKEDLGEAEETEDNLWGAFCEAEMMLPNIHTLTWITFTFAPASIELLEPAKITLKDKQVTDVFGDLLSMLHDTNTKFIQTDNVNRALIQNINAILRNAILVALAKETKTADELGVLVGVPAKDLKLYLTAMIKEGKLKEEKGKYTRIK